VLNWWLKNNHFGSENDDSWNKIAGCSQFSVGYVVGPKAGFYRFLIHFYLFKSIIYVFDIPFASLSSLFERTKNAQ